MSVRSPRLLQLIKERNEKMKKERTQGQKKAIFIVWISLCGVLFILGVTLFTLSIWYKSTFQMPFRELLFTLFSPLQGTGQSTVELILSSCLPFVIAALVLYVALAVFLVLHRDRFLLLRRIGAACCAVIFLSSIVFSCFAVGMDEYIVDAMEPVETDRSFYETYYVDPLDVAVTAEGKPKNLIYIYLESMETTYASKTSGGFQSFNYMPNLTLLARENLSFSNTTALGGFRSPAGTGWTMGALLGMTAGIPFSLEVFGEESHNNLGNYDLILPGLTTLGDVLAQKGYTQEFLCGSDASFAGRDKYFQQHGGYEIFDLHSARKQGYVPNDYYVWWGVEDHRLFDIAKDEVTRLAAGEAPFNLTMLTVDAHHVNGYICSECRADYSDRLANVVACTDRLVSEFIEWCREQPFFEDTVIILAGDHPRMDTALVKNVDVEDRVMYNCFINTDTVPQASLTNRSFTSFDMFPTTLAALGFSIEGERLGLGTNLFSSVPTLTEQNGYEWLEDEIKKYSDYYVKEFL